MSRASPHPSFNHRGKNEQKSGWHPAPTPAPAHRETGSQKPSIHTHTQIPCVQRTSFVLSFNLQTDRAAVSKPTSLLTHIHPKSRHCPAILVQEWALSSVWLSWGKQLLTADSGELNPQLICLKQGSLRSHLCDSLTRPSLEKLGEKRKEKRERKPYQQRNQRQGFKTHHIPFPKTQHGYCGKHKYPSLLTGGVSSCPRKGELDPATSNTLHRLLFLK